MGVEKSSLEVLKYRYDIPINIQMLLKSGIGVMLKIEKNAMKDINNISKYESISIRRKLGRRYI